MILVAANLPSEHRLYNARVIEDITDCTRWIRSLWCHRCQSAFEAGSLTRNKYSCLTFKPLSSTINHRDYTLPIRISIFIKFGKIPKSFIEPRSCFDIVKSCYYYIKIAVPFFLKILEW